MSTALRTTARLDADEAEFVARMKMPGTDEAAAARELLGTDDLAELPTGTIIHKLIETGIQTVKDKADQVGHARLTEFLRTDPEHQAWRNSRRKRAAARSEGVS